MRRATLLTVALLLAAGAAARADVLHLRNGRTLEGRVVRRTETEVHVRLAAGILVVPLSTIAAIDTRSTAEDELADALGEIDLGDPVAVERLAMWASRRGLGDQAGDLLDLSRGVRLERVVAAARAERSPWAFVDAYHWARSQGLDELTEGWLLSQAEALAPGDPAVVEARATFGRDAASAASAEARAAARRSLPSYLDPAQTHLPGDGIDGLRAVKLSAGRLPGDPDPGARGRALVERLERLRGGKAGPPVGVKSRPPGAYRRGA